MHIARRKRTRNCASVVLTAFMLSAIIRLSVNWFAIVLENAAALTTQGTESSVRKRSTGTYVQIATGFLRLTSNFKAAALASIQSKNSVYMASSERPIIAIPNARNSTGAQSTNIIVFARGAQR